MVLDLPQQVYNRNIVMLYLSEYACSSYTALLFVLLRASLLIYILECF